MDLKNLVTRPELVKITLDDEETVREFGEAIDFYTWSRQPLDVFLKLSANIQDDPKRVLDVVKTLILDAQGQPVMTTEELIPTSLMIKALARIMELLGK
jgi:hypothetical protein